MKNTHIDELLRIADAISRGEIPEYQHNECFTAGAFDLLLVNAHGGDAFALLSQLCQRYEAVKSSGTDLKGYFHLLTELARQSDTTEIPVGLKEILMENPGLSHALNDWYRQAG